MDGKIYRPSFVWRVWDMRKPKKQKDNIERWSDGVIRTHGVPEPVPAYRKIYWKIKKWFKWVFWLSVLLIAICLFPILVIIFPVGMTALMALFWIITE